MVELNKIVFGDCLEVLNNIPDDSIDCCVTSPPYYGLRDYGVDGQIGLEETPEQYVEKMVKVFGHIKRCLKPEGSLWLNLGDSYAGSGCGRNGNGEIGILNSAKQRSNQGANIGNLHGISKTGEGLKPKDLIGIPWMVAFALRGDGWYLRQDIIWSKPNPMPESVTDRCTKSHEYIFLMSKSREYYYDYESIKEDSKRPGEIGILGFMKGAEININDPNYRTTGQQNATVITGEKANKKDVWNIPLNGFPEAHFATFPEKLIVDCIKAGCPEKYIVCESCGNVLYLQSNTNGNGEDKMQIMRSRDSQIRRSQEDTSVLFQEMQSNMDCTTQENNKGMDNNIERIQNGCNERSSFCNELRVCDGTQGSNGETPREVSKKKRNSSSYKRDQNRQSNRESIIDDNGRTQSFKEAENKTNNLSSLWEEDKNIGTCEKCGGNLIGRRGLILDPFMGAGTTGLVARKLNRNYIGIELNPEYIKIAERRIFNEIGLFI